MKVFFQILLITLFFSCNAEGQCDYIVTKCKDRCQTCSTCADDSNHLQNYYDALCRTQREIESTRVLWLGDSNVKNPTRGKKQRDFAFKDLVPNAPNWSSPNYIDFSFDRQETTSVDDGLGVPWSINSITVNDKSLVTFISITTTGQSHNMSLAMGSVYADAGALFTITPNTNNQSTKFDCGEIYYSNDNGANGTFRYRFSGGAWTTVDTGTATGFQTESFTTTFDDHVVEVEVLTGQVHLYSIVFCDEDQDDVEILNIAQGGSTLLQWGGGKHDIDNWIDQAVHYDPHLITIQAGTNDVGGNRTCDQLISNLDSLVSRIQLALPDTDILIISPPARDESPNGNVNTGLYDQCMKEYCCNEKIGFFSLYSMFPDLDKAIADGDMRTDRVHLTTQGGQKYSDELMRCLRYGF